MTNKLIYASLTSLVLLGGLSFFVDPRYEKGVWIAMVATSNLLSALVGGKLGLASPDTPSVPVGTSGVSTETTTTVKP